MAGAGKSKVKWGKILLWILCVTPICWLAKRGLNQDLTANPIEYITHFTGNWTLRLIVATLAVSPLRRLLNAPGLIRYRRPLGLFAFFYGSLHFLTWLWLDKFFVWHDMLKDVAKRPFITAGFTAFVCMIPLAATSTSGWIRRLGGKRWANLHRLIYVTAAAGVIHYYWLVKSDHRLPLMYGGLVAVEFAYRLIAPRLKRTPAPPPRKVLTEA